MSGEDLGLNLLMVLHGLSSGVLAGAAIHNGWLGYRGLRHGATPSARLTRLYPTVIAVAFVLTVGLGLLIYPTFRVDVRAGWLDQALPWATALFELKEHGVAIAALLLTYLVPTSRGLPEHRGAVFHAASVGVACLISYALLIGLFVGTLRGS